MQQTAGDAQYRLPQSVEPGDGAALDESRSPAAGGGSEHTYEAASLKRHGGGAGGPDGGAGEASSLGVSGGRSARGNYSMGSASGRSLTSGRPPVDRMSLGRQSQPPQMARPGGTVGSSSSSPRAVWSPDSLALDEDPRLFARSDSGSQRSGESSGGDRASLGGSLRSAGGSSSKRRNDSSSRGRRVGSHAGSYKGAARANVHNLFTVEEEAISIVDMVLSHSGSQDLSGSGPNIVDAPPKSPSVQAEGHPHTGDTTVATILDEALRKNQTRHTAH